MICLGIESTAHTFGVAEIDDEGNTISNVKDTCKNPFAIHPREASEHHVAVAADVVKEAMVEKPDLIAFASGPGLGPCLRIGSVVARTIAHKLKIPLVGVNHCVAHLEIAKLTSGAKDPVFVYLSGGNSQILSYVEGRYRAVGETLDIGLGNALDRFARAAGLKGAPEIENIAKKGNKLLELPYTVKGMDFSFTGMVTHCQRLLEKESLEDLCYSIQEYSFATVTEVSERAMAALDKKEILLTGGVVANKRLQEMAAKMAEDRGGKSFVVVGEFAGDNGLMIAWTGILVHKSGSSGNLEVNQKWRTDEVDIPWMEKNR
jgi:glycoprotease/Kae1 family metallohydrolase